MKRYKCTKCNKYKIRSAYGTRRGTSKSMRRKVCKVCIQKRKKELLKDPIRHQKHCQSQHKYYISHKEKINAKHNQYHEDHAEEVCTRTKRNYNKNKARRKITSAAKYLRNKKHILLKQREWALKNPDKRNASSRRWRAKHPEKAKATHEAWFKKHLGKRREYDRKKRIQRSSMKIHVNENFTAEDEAVVFKVFKYRCFHCGTTKHLTLDHFYPLSKGHPLELGNAIILCRSCNASKHNKDPGEFFAKFEMKSVRKLMTKTLRLAHA